jgi:hypothetical protein
MCQVFVLFDYRRSLKFLPARDNNSAQSYKAGSHTPILPIRLFLPKGKQTVNFLSPPVPDAARR